MWIFVVVEWWFGCGGAAVWGRAVMRCRWVCRWSAYAFALVSTFAVSHNFWPSLGLQFANLGKARPLHQNCIRGRASLRKWQSDRAMGVPCAHCSLSREASPIYNEPPRRASPAHRRELQRLLAGAACARAGRRERSRRRRHGGQGSSPALALALALGLGRRPWHKPGLAQVVQVLAPQQGVVYGT